MCSRPHRRTFMTRHTYALLPSSHLPNWHDTSSLPSASGIAPFHHSPATTVTSPNVLCAVLTDVRPIGPVTGHLPSCLPRSHSALTVPHLNPPPNASDAKSERQKCNDRDIGQSRMRTFRPRRKEQASAVSDLCPVDDEVASGILPLALSFLPEPRTLRTRTSKPTAP